MFRFFLHKTIQRWDYSNHKVVRYDHNIGDKHEPKGGHGTKCTGAAAGKVAGKDYEANSEAENTKLHIIDIQKENNTFVIFKMETFKLKNVFY